MQREDACLTILVAMFLGIVKQKMENRGIDIIKHTLAINMIVSIGGLAVSKFGIP